MIRELKTVEYSCDFGCGTKVVASSFGGDLPQGWGTVKVGPCGITNYYRDDLACPTCLAKYSK